VPELHFWTSLFRPRAGELSFPVQLRFCLAWDARVLSEVLGLFVRALFAFQRRTARRLGVPGPLTGAVAFVQRFGSALQLTPQFPTWQLFENSAKKHQLFSMQLSRTTGTVRFRAPTFHSLIHFGTAPALTPQSQFDEVSANPLCAPTSEDVPSSLRAEP
jgi:hypothetical protein